jgi:DNA excision repair protein ERCC-2
MPVIVLTSVAYLNNMIHLHLSVHDIVDLMLRTGDLDTRIFNRSTMMEGTKMHLQYQREQRIPGYQSEVSLHHDYTYRDLVLHVLGKADGLYIDHDTLVIEEIKTTIADVKDFASKHQKWHIMQAAFYGHMYALEHDYKHILIRLIYLNQGNKDRHEMTFEFTLEEIEKDVQGVIDEYGAFYQLTRLHRETLLKSLPTLKFPFTQYRQGQRALAKYVYGVSQKGGRLYVEAPTGIGKTMSTLFPVIKTLGTVHEKVFYFTAKNSGKIAAEEALKVLIHEGASLSYCVITAKETMSFCPKGKINPDDCLYARGYYDKIKDVLTYALTNFVQFDKDTIQAIAEQFKIEPFEFSLDLSLFVDVIIADYNYLFDPSAYLRRFFESVTQPYAVLIDEAHNLVERSRDMYSSFLQESMIKQLKKAIDSDYSTTLKKSIKRLEKQWNLFHDQTPPTLVNSPDELLAAIEKFLLDAQLEMKNLRTSLPDIAMDVYFKCLRFMNTTELIADHYHYVLTEEQNDLTLTLYCLDPSKQITKTLDALRTVITFSGTLSPMDYYLPMLGWRPQDAVLKLPSPFKAEHFKVMITDHMATTLRRRDQSYASIAKYIEAMIEGKMGNYLVFFPSYKYLMDVYEQFNPKEDVHILLQHKDMKQEEKQQFLDHFIFLPTKTTIGFAVLGGVFSEGIDLIADRLIGVGIVSVGLPQLSFVRDLISDYYRKQEQDGFQFAYVYPAINKVLQAMGRVIRSETDRGVALLMDERFLQDEYRDILQKYAQYEVVISPDDVADKVVSFFKKD